MLPRRKSPIETSRANSPARWLSSSGSDGSLIRASASGCLIHNQTTPRPAPIPGTYDRVAHPVAGADPPSKAAVPAPCPIGGVPAGSNGHSRSDHRYLRRLRNRQVAGGQRHRVLKLIVQPPGSIYAVWDIRGTQRYGRPKPQALSQVTRKKPTWITAVCKTVGSAYVGSNPTPATPWGNGPIAADSRLSGPFLLRPSVCHLVALWTAVSRCPRTYSGQRRAARTVGVTVGFHGRPRTGRLTGCSGLTRSAESSVYPLRHRLAVLGVSYRARGRSLGRVNTIDSVVGPLHFGDRVLWCVGSGCARLGPHRPCARRRWRT